MRKIIYPKAGPPEVMWIVDAHDLKAGPGEVVVRVHRSGINFADLMMRLGIYDTAPPFPFTPGWEVAGTVMAVGEAVEGLEPGQRVVAFTNFEGYAEQALVKHEHLLRLSDDVSLDAAAAMPVTYLTAFHMLVHLGNIQTGETVLVHHAAGGVGTAAAQIAKVYGAGRIFGVASSPKKEFVEEHGMTFIDRDGEDFVAAVKRETEGIGVHHALDPVGGPHLKRSFKALRQGGKLYAFGGSTFVPGPTFSRLKALVQLIRTPRFNPMKLIGGNRAIFGVHIGRSKDFTRMKKHMLQLMELLNSQKIAPVVDRVFPFERVAEAHHYMHARKNRGKVLLDFSPEQDAEG
jgi:NADPH:quinone reductase-like Zn-dependent oxidoreductase